MGHATDLNLSCHFCQSGKLCFIIPIQWVQMGVLTLKATMCVCVKSVNKGVKLS